MDLIIASLMVGLAIFVLGYVVGKAAGYEIAVEEIERELKERRG